MRRRWRAARWLLAALLPVLGIGHALDVTVDAAGGPLTLEDEVAAALSDWRAAGVDVDAVAARVSVRYGPAERFGPDVQAWVVVRDAPAGDDRSYEILIAPGATAVRAALIPALGVALGGSLGTGALDPVLDPAGPRRPDASDGAALEARRDALPGDLNGDGKVGFADLVLFAEAFGRTGVNLAADLNGDGVVDEADLALLRAAYAFEPPTLGD